ncbi:MAG: hypothetical protein AB7U95_26585 [Reyranella sp.]
MLGEFVPDPCRSPGWRTQSLRPMIGRPLASTEPAVEPDILSLGVGDVIGWDGIVGVDIVWVWLGDVGWLG